MALIYANDGEPGIRRRRAGRAVATSGTTENGARSSGAGQDQGLVIPPAWNDVWIAPSADFHLQVTGKDVRGRKQYRYHERWTACRDEVKYANLIEFARALPRLRQAIDADLGRRGLGRERVLATVTRLLDTTMIRVGNAAYARDNGSFGLTTFRDRHVSVEGSTLALPLQGQVGQGVAAEGDRPPDRPDRQGCPGSAGPAPLPVRRRGWRAAARHVERRERLYPCGRGRTVLVEALPHLGRHGPGASAVFRARAAGDQARPRRRDERGHRRGLAPARQHAGGLPQVLRTSLGSGELAGGAPRRGESRSSGDGTEGRRQAFIGRSTLRCDGWRPRPTHHDRLGEGAGELGRLAGSSRARVASRVRADDIAGAARPGTAALQGRTSPSSWVRMARSHASDAISSMQAMPARRAEPPVPARPRDPDRDRSAPEPAGGRDVRKTVIRQTVTRGAGEWRRRRPITKPSASGPTLGTAGRRGSRAPATRRTPGFSGSISGNRKRISRRSPGRSSSRSSRKASWLCSTRTSPLAGSASSRAASARPGPEGALRRLGDNGPSNAPFALLWLAAMTLTRWKTHNSFQPSLIAHLADAGVWSELLQNSFAPVTPVTLPIVPRFRGWPEPKHVNASNAETGR